MYLDMYNKLEVICDELESMISRLNYDEIDCNYIKDALSNLKSSMDALSNSDEFKQEHDEYFL